MDDSYLSNSSVGDSIPAGITAKDVMIGQSNNSTTQFKSQGIKQLLSQTPSTGGSGANS
jgi:hypothetical protein